MQFSDKVAHLVGYNDLEKILTADSSFNFYFILCFLTRGIWNRVQSIVK